MKNWMPFTALFLALTFVVGCYYDNEEDLYPTSGTCNTDNRSYSQHVVPLLTNASCYTCHSQASAQGGVVLETYADLKIFVDNGILLKSLKHEAGAVAMPYPAGSPKINSCAISQIEAWITQGAQNN